MTAVPWVKHLVHFSLSYFSFNEYAEEPITSAVVFSIVEVENNFLCISDDVSFKLVGDGDVSPDCCLTEKYIPHTLNRPGRPVRVPKGPNIFRRILENVECKYIENCVALRSCCCRCCCPAMLNLCLLPHNVLFYTFEDLIARSDHMYHILTKK